MAMIRLTTGVALLAAPLFSVPAIAADTPNTLRRATERACIHQGRQQGLIVRRVSEVKVVSGSGGRAVGTKAVLSVKRDGSSYQVRCSYSLGDRVATISSMKPSG